MSRFLEKLSRLRGAYIVYFVVLVLVDVLAAWRMAGGWSGSGTSHLGLAYGAFLAVFLPVSAALFALGLFLVRLTIRKTNWARVVLLIVGWLTVFDALSSLLFTAWAPQAAHWLNKLVPGVDWDHAILVDRIKDVLGLAYWGYLVYVLQFDRDIKDEFEARGPAAPGPGAPGA